MAIPEFILSDEQARVVRDNEPTFSDRQGIDLPGLLNSFAQQVAAELNGKIVSDKAVVPTGTDTVTVSDAALAGLGGAVAVATLAEADGTLAVANVVWSGDDLVITLTGNATDDRDVAWLVDAR